MILRDVTTIWGNDHLVRSRPSIEEHFDVLFVPFTVGVHLDHDRQWGIFSRDGRLIDSSGYFRGQHALVCGNSTTDINFDDVPYAPEQHYIYGGPIINHFGHFLISSLSRLWFLEFHEKTSPILCHSHGAIPDWFNPSYREEFWKGANLEAKDFATFETPVRIRHLSIPRASLEEQNFVHDVYGRMMRKIGDRIVGQRPIRSNTTPAYLSKHQMRNGVTKIGNEEEIIDVLRDAGVEIFCPETMSLPDQISLFRERQTIIGTSSSAFHMSIFSELENDIFCILPTNLLNSNFKLIDKAAKNKSRYLFPKSGTEQHENTLGFNLYSIVSDPKGIAHEILSRID